MGLTREIVYLRDFAAAAAKLQGDFGKTNRYSTGDRALDIYLGGGYGRNDGYEIVVLYGEPGIGKSTVALNFLKSPLQEGRKVGMLVLEDDGADVFIRFSNVLGTEGARQYIMQGDSIHFTPPDVMMKSWKLADLLVMIEEWFDQRDIDVLLLDHLQFAFEGAESIKGENEYIAQRVFMQKLNQMMKKNKKTIILVSHVSKASTAKGMNRIAGSSAIAGAGTKVIEVSPGDNGKIELRMWKTRFTKNPGYGFMMKLVNGRLVSPT